MGYTGTTAGVEEFGILLRDDGREGSLYGAYSSVGAAGTEVDSDFVAGDDRCVGVLNRAGWRSDGAEGDGFELVGAGEKVSAGGHLEGPVDGEGSTDFGCPCVSVGEGSDDAVAGVVGGDDGGSEGCEGEYGWGSVDDSEACADLLAEGVTGNVPVEAGSWSAYTADVEGVSVPRVALGLGEDSAPSAGEQRE